MFQFHVMFTVYNIADTTTWRELNIRSSIPSPAALNLPKLGVTHLLHRILGRN